MASKIVNPKVWLDNIFRSKAARKGGIVRRNVISVAQNCGFDMLLAEVKRRGFHMFESGGQYVIFCHDGDFKMIT